MTSPIFSLLPVKTLRQTEVINLQNLNSLIGKIKQDRCWVAPIWVHVGHDVVLDGNHRLNAARELRMQLVPCYLMDYDDAKLQVLCRHSDDRFDGLRVIQAGISGKLLPYKSSRHIYNSALPKCQIEISNLLR